MRTTQTKNFVVAVMAVVFLILLTEAVRESEANVRERRQLGYVINPDNNNNNNNNQRPPFNPNYNNNNNNNQRPPFNPNYNNNNNNNQRPPFNPNNNNNNNNNQRPPLGYVINPDNNNNNNNNNQRNCDFGCLLRYEPVCARDGGRFRTFENSCMLNAENCRARREVWYFIYDGVCE